jgi:hypothetical protein
MSNKSKFLYSFTIEKEVEKQVVEEKMEGDQKVTVTRTEKVKEPVKFSILKPTRKLYDMAEIFLAKTVSDYIKEGIIPISLVAKRFGNDGGVLTEKEAEYVVDLQKRLDENQKKLVDLQLEPKEGEEKPKLSDEDRTKLFVEMMKTQAEIDRVRTSYLSLYENTAEMKGRKKTIEWWITMLSYKDGEKPEEFFNQPSFRERYEKYVEILDGDDEFSKKVATKFTFLIGTWFNSSSTELTNEDFVSADQAFEQNFKDE